MCTPDGEGRGEKKRDSVIICKSERRREEGLEVMILLG